MRYRLVFFYVLVLLTTVSYSAVGDSADTLFLPPIPGSLQKSMGPNAKLGNIPVASLANYPHPIYGYSGMSGKKSFFYEEARDKQPLRISAEEKTDIEGRLIFGDPILFSDGHYYAIGEFMVESAEGIRLIMDLSQLSYSDKLWLIVPDLYMVYGPFDNAGDQSDETWLPTVYKESVILVLQTDKETLPLLKLKSFLFYYMPFESFAKALPCPLHIGCVDDPEFQKVSTAVGMLSIPVRNYGEIICTGTLINVPETPELEPYLISAHHCFADTNIRWSAIQVIWDYRAEDCSGFPFPDPDTCPVTTGAINLVESECIDGQLIKLIGDIPIGNYGRAYAGWSSNELTSGMTFYGAHHLEGTALKSAIGKITKTDTESCMDSLCAEIRYHTIEVLWDEGVTSQGSSGSGAFCKDFNYQLVGMLSNGPTHNCRDRSRNYDYFASFRYFYPLIQCYLKPGTKCEERADCGGSCFLKTIFSQKSEQLLFFRQIRSWLGQQGDWGKNLIKFYYKQSPIWINQSQQNPILRSTIKTILTEPE
ncbi:MAG: hypothetical protein LDL53_09070 [Candidatus Hydrogenedens sp.]|nr:hypothetical protein [Candidatus Hydrogenedens sp.]